MSDQTVERPETPESETEDAAGGQAPYRVLARKYRPASFADLIGQEAVVRTLANAIAGGRIAHAFILTGVRGVGKTTTARIIARALNCVGPEGGGGPTAEPCGLCEHCQSIAQDRHVDVIEMDAASRTGIDDIRELIEGVRYRPVSARNKVYIIDEVHMLSRQAFNGLLKTLEEPPEHVVFIFATTEIRKVPVTVLSRCQRFDLRRVDQEVLAGHFARIAQAEGIQVTPPALALIARAADGSVRDGLSLLDQAIALGGGTVEEDHVKDMLGLADRTRVFDLFEAVMGGRAAAALDLLGDMYAAGADPLVVLQDLAELTHFLTRLSLVPALAEAPGTPEAERSRGRELAEKLSIPILARTWQMLLKGIGETRQAPLRLQAAEMVLVRLAYAGELPTPGDLVKRLQGATGAEPARAPAPSSQEAPGPTGPSAIQLDPEPVDLMDEPQAALGPAAAPAPASQAKQGDEAETPAAMPASFAEVVDLARRRREGILAGHLAGDLHLVRFEPGRIEFRPGERAPRDLAGRLGDFLRAATGERWLVSVSGDGGAPTLRQQTTAAEAALREQALQEPLVQAVLEAFPGAQIVGATSGPTPGAEPGGDTVETSGDTAKEGVESP
jgi:DNA polymerase-3 subunit gamma/tau